MVDLPILGDGVVLDRLVRSDAAELASSHSDVENARFQGWPSPLDVQDALAFIEANARLDAFAPGVGAQLAIRRDLGGTLIGDLYVHRSESPADAVAMGITLGPASQGHGHARSAIDAVAAAIRACPDAGISRMVAVIDVDNVASVRLFRRAGFTESGRLQGTSERRDGSIGDEVILTLDVRESDLSAATEDPGPRPPAT